MWSAGIALRFRSIQAGPLMQMPVFLILFLAPVYVPVELLTSWIHAVAEVNPITPIVEAQREPDRRELGPASASPTLAGAAMVAVFLVWAITGMRRAEASGG